MRSGLGIVVVVPVPPLVRRGLRVTGVKYNFREECGRSPALSLAAYVETPTVKLNAAKARKIGRDFLELYLQLPNYTNNFLSLGFDENDFRNGGSDRFIDAIIAWGDLNAIRNRIREHHSAGADHVSVQVLTTDRHALPLPEWRELASAVL